MVGVQFTSKEAQRLLHAIAEGKLGPVDDPELVALERKLKVMHQVAIEVDKRPRPGQASRMAEGAGSGGRVPPGRAAAANPPASTAMQRSDTD
jgi:hypothetical protein